MATDKSNEVTVSIQFEIKSQELLAKFKQLTQTEARVVQQANPFVLGISDWVAGARPFYDHYTLAIEQGRNYLASGTQALQKGDANQAGRFLEEAEQFLRKAEFSFKNYLRATQGGAESVVNTLTPIRNSTLTFAATGAAALTAGVATPFAVALATSAGWHSGFLSLSYSPRIDDTTQTFAVEFPPRETSPSEPNKKTSTTKKSDPLAEAQEDLRLLEKILRAIDESEQATQELKRKFQIAIQTIPKSQPPPVEPKRVAIKPALVSPPAPNLPSETELIEQAKQALREWRRDPRVVHPLGRFLLATEFSEANASQEILTKWQNSLSNYRVAIDPNPKAWQGNVNRLMYDLFNDGLGSYVKGHARLTNFLKGEGGNCEAQTKWILATFAETGLKFPEPYQSAIQVFSDHVEPVIVDQKEGRVWNLIRNQWISNNEAPLYDPHLFYYAYLRAKGVHTPIKENDLLLARTDWLSKFKSIPLALLAPIFKLGSRSTNTNLKFPKEAELFGLGRVPERARLPNLYTYIPGERAISLRGWDERGEIGQDYRQPQYEIDRFGFDLTPSPRVLILETDAQATFYNQLPTIKEKRNFLIDLALQKLEPTLRSPSFERVLTLLSRPSITKQLRLEEIEEGRETLIFVQRFLYFLAMKFDSAFPQRESSEEESQAIRKAAFKDIVSRHPLLTLFAEKKKGFQERINKNALSFLLFADQLAKEKRGHFISWLEEAGKELEEFLSDGSHITRQAISEVIADKDLIDIKEETNILKSQYAEVELVVVDDYQEIDLPPRTGPEQKRRPHLISPETMIAFLFLYCEEKGVSARWTPTLSRKLFEKNILENRGPFFNIYRKLFKHYPKTEKWVKDPLQTWSEFQISQMTPEGKRLLRKDMAQHPEAEKTSGEALIPPDFEPILYQILRQNLRYEEPEKIALFFQTHPDIAQKLTRM